MSYHTWSSLGMESEETEMNGTTADEVEAETLKGGQDENEDIPPN